MFHPSGSLTLFAFLLNQHVLQRPSSAVTSGEITAVNAPMSQPLFAGTPLGAIDQIATWRDTANYSSSVGLIEPIDVRVDGVAQPDSFVLSEGQEVVVHVADTLGNEVSFPIESAVQYTVRLLSEATDDQVLSINDAAPDGTPLLSLTAVQDGTGYTYSGHTAGTFRTGPVFADGYPVVTHSGTGTDPVPGDILTCDPGPLLFTGTLSNPGFVYLRDGVPTGTTTATYVVQASDTGHSLTAEVTFSDDAGSRSAAGAPG